MSRKEGPEDLEFHYYDQLVTPNPPMPVEFTNTEMIEAVLMRDLSKDHLFYVGVVSTGIYCRCVCPARKPLPKNMLFFTTHEEAERSGFRPCKRCKPKAIA